MTFCRGRHKIAAKLLYNFVPYKSQQMLIPRSQISLIDTTNFSQVKVKQTSLNAHNF